jgi:hypothetical protein
MRCDEAFVLGAMTGAVVVWLWGRKIEDRIADKTRAIRTKAADGIQAVEETIRPTVPSAPSASPRGVEAWA